jgi:hypothetical protein
MNNFLNRENNPRREQSSRRTAFRIVDAKQDNHATKHSKIQQFGKTLTGSHP